MPSASARLFFALWPDDPSRAALAAAFAPAVREVTAGQQSSARAVAGNPRREAGAARPVPAANYHFTLAFLGAVPVPEIERLCGVAAQSAEACRRNASDPISITLDNLEHWRKPQVLVASSSTTSPLAALLAEHLTHALIAAGFSPDPKPFRPHLTLARKVVTPFPAIPITPRQLAFRDFALVESQTGSEGPAYAVLRKFPLSRQDATNHGL